MVELNLPPLSAEKLEFVNYVQAIAVERRRWVGTYEELRAFLVKVLPPGLSAETVAFNDPRLHSELISHRDVAMWCGSDMRYRLIDLRAPRSIKAAVTHAEHNPGQDICNFCLIDENRTPLELVSYKDPFTNHPLFNTRVHTRCARAFTRVRQVAMKDADYAKRNTPRR